MLNESIYIYFFLYKFYKLLVTTMDTLKNLGKKLGGDDKKDDDKKDK